MDRRTFTGSALGAIGALAQGTVTTSEAASQAAKPISAAGMARDKKNAVPYAKPKGLRNGFDSVDMNEVMVVQQQPAVRVKLESAGKPQAAQLDDGTVIVAGFIEPPVHKQSRCTLQYSRDNARTFGKPVVLDMPGRTGGFRCLKNGTLILGHSAGISRSTDSGKTWSTWTFPTKIVPGTGRLGLGECHGPIELDDGTLAMHLYRVVGGYQWNAYLIRSTDDGKTWGDPTQVPTRTDSDEISYEYIADKKRIFGVTRSSAAQIRRVKEFADQVPGGKNAPLGSEAGDAAFQFHSDDGGRTWTDPIPTGLGVLQAAGAYPLKLADGRMLLLYGNRQFPYGTQVVGSHDNGKTWALDQPILLSWHSWSGYCGHPRSVQ
ncbi:MAG: sialidase family protein, partial [Planctomycetota bacterium]|nr:sialidase family protein [Planctomycetota bacterium]